MNKPQIIAPSLKDIQAASKLIAPYIIRSPLLRLNIDDRDKDIYLKLENLRPIAVFKVRSIGNALLSANEQTLAKGVYTASSGNAGIDLAWPGWQANLDSRPESISQHQVRRANSRP